MLERDSRVLERPTVVHVLISCQATGPDSFSEVNGNVRDASTHVPHTESVAEQAGQVRASSMVLTPRCHAVFVAFSRKQRGRLREIWCHICTTETHWAQLMSSS